MTTRPIYKTPAAEQAVMKGYDRILAQLPESVERLEIETRHGRTFVLAQGSVHGFPVVLLHGAGSNSLAWGRDMPEFAKRYRVYAVDTPGDPGRSCHERIPWEGEGIVEWLEDVLDGLGAPRPVLVGLSQGGYIALRFASARPGRVEALVLLAPGGLTPARLGFLVRAIAYRAAGRRGTSALMRYVLGDEEMPQDALDYLSLIFTGFRFRTEPLPPVSDADLRGLGMPTLLVVGGRDGVLDSAKTVERFRRSGAGVEVHLLPGAGHALVGVAPLVLPFLSGVAAGSPAAGTSAEQPPVAEAAVR